MSLKISSDYCFHTIQGEGPSIGHNAVFLRLAHCTLSCVWCDTIEVWKQSTTLTNADLLALMAARQCIDPLKKGARLILTGGSPLMQQKELAGFVGYLNLSLGELPNHVTVEVETEGVLMPDELIPLTSQWNVSPKLENSGMPKNRRYKPEVLDYHAHQLPSWFKFVVDTADDMTEVDQIVKDIRIKPNRVFLMPQARSRAELDAKSPALVELCKWKGYNFSTRLHVQLWDKLTGV